MPKTAFHIMPIAIGAFAIVAFLLLADFSIGVFSPGKKVPANKNAVACTDEAKVCPDGTTVGRTGPDCAFAPCPSTNSNSSSNANANTNTAVDTGYAAPAGPFTVGSTKLLNIAYRKQNDQLLLRLAKIDVTMDAQVKEGVLKSLDIQTAAGMKFVPDAVRQVVFGTDGDSVVFVASESKTPVIGIYRTSLSNPKKIETVVQYDTDNLYNDDLPSISQVSYNAASNTVAYVISGQPNTKNNDVLVVNLADKKPRRLKSYPDAPQIVGFPSAGAEVEVLWENDDEKSSTPAGVWSYDRIRISDATVVKTVKLLDEKELHAQMYLNGDNISPNNNVLVFTNYDDQTNRYELRFKVIATGKITKVTLPNRVYYGGVYWSTDSGKVVLRTSAGGTIYDLAGGVVDTIKDFGTGIVWYPGKYILYQDNQGANFSYDPATKKSVKLTSLQDGFGGYYDGYSGGSASARNWVNR